MQFRQIGEKRDSHILGWVASSIYPRFISLSELLAFSSIQEFFVFCFFISFVLVPSALDSDRVCCLRIHSHHQVE